MGDEEAVVLIFPAQKSGEFTSLLRNLRKNATISEPAALDPSGNLNAGLTPEDVRQALEFVTLICTTGTSVLTLVQLLRDELKSWTGGKVVVADAKNGKPKLRISKETTDAEIDEAGL